MRKARFGAPAPINIFTHQGQGENKVTSHLICCKGQFFFFILNTLLLIFFTFIYLFISVHEHLIYSFVWYMIRSMGSHGGTLGW